MTRINRISVKNFGKIVVLDYSPTTNVVTISGRNAQGKSAAMDAIMAALDGKSVSSRISQPIREGQDSAVIEIELDDLVITRRYTKNDSGTLAVKAKDGASYSNGATVLKEFFGKIAFDPMVFASLKGADQLAALVKVVDLPFDPEELAKERQGVYDRRTEVSRDVKKLEAQLAGFPNADPTLPADPVSAADIIAEREKAAEHNANIQRAINLAAELEREVEAGDRTIAQLEKELADVRAARDDREARRVGAAALAESVEPMDLAAITERLHGVEALNERIRTQARRAEVAAELSEKKQAAGKLTADLQLTDKRKADALAAVAFPVPGLSFDDNGVLYNGIPFEQASTAEKVRVSTALGMAVNPTLRVMQIRDGSLLDDDSLRIIDELATANDFQIFVELVNPSDRPGFVMEQGEIASVNS